MGKPDLQIQMEINQALYAKIERLEIDKKALLEAAKIGLNYIHDSHGGFEDLETVSKAIQEAEK